MTALRSAAFPRHVPLGEEIATQSQPLRAELPPAELRRLVVVEGPDAGRAFTLDPNAPGRLLVGTSPACAVRLTDPCVSRRQAALEPAGKRYRLADLGSTNGTFVDGVAVIEAFVRGDEIIRCGSTALRFECETIEGSRPGARETPLPSAMRFGPLLGASTSMRRLYPLCERLASVRVPVIIEGETGTGKEVLAEALHEQGGSTGPFVVFDCTTVSPALAEAELFGHERGAFTGAVATRTGVFEDAHGGTILIDEIGDLDLALQTKLLRVIDRGELRRVGGSETIRVDVRILAATRRDLDREVAEGRFRDDLFHRLAVARVELPPLRQRSGDVALLARHFASSLGGVLPAAVVSRFEAYPWPGNVRELKNAVARYLAVGEEPEPLSGEKPRPVATGDTLEGVLDAGLPYPLARRKMLAEFEQRYVERILAEHGGNVSQAARASGLALRYFRLVKSRTRRA